MERKQLQRRSQLSKTIIFTSTIFTFWKTRVSMIRINPLQFYRFRHSDRNRANMNNSNETFPPENVLLYEDDLNSSVILLFHYLWVIATRVSLVFCQTFVHFWPPPPPTSCFWKSFKLCVGLLSSNCDPFISSLLGMFARYTRLLSVTPQSLTTSGITSGYYPKQAYGF